MLENKIVYLSTYILQKDMRVRLPKTVLKNLNIENGKNSFDIYYDQDNQQLILRVATNGDDYK
ncbi:MAG: AbrB/MazE/SpoVT family DNA-binding domain-containing protein [Peptostreptococcaceae bacterium]